MQTLLRKESGYALLGAIFVVVLGLTFTVGYVNWTIASLKVANQTFNRELALQIAESGIEYYRWHLAHDEDDFCDGRDTCSGDGPYGPFVHDFFDKDLEKVGEFILMITPPDTGSTKVTIESTGTILNENTSRTIRAELAIPSFAKYSVLADADIRFGEGTEVFGPLHSNEGIRFDGLAHNVVTSSEITYNDDDSDACTGYSWAVHTCLSPADSAPPGSPTEPYALPLRTDVFEVGRNVGLPEIDFSGLTSDLATLQDIANAEGTAFGSSNYYGWHLTLNDNDTFDLSRVRRLRNKPSQCTEPWWDEGWSTWSIGTSGNSEIEVLDDEPLPPSGVIFLEDHTWVDGTINGAKVTIAVGTFTTQEENWKNIIINNNLLYTNYDGSDTIGLIAQNNINVGMASSTNLRIDGALIAQNGRVGRHYYEEDCSPWHERNTITLYGAIATKNRYGFAWTDDDAPGYVTRNIIYDSQLLYEPPPSFPLTTDGYEILSWEEI